MMKAVILFDGRTVSNSFVDGTRFIETRHRPLTEAEALEQAESLQVRFGPERAEQFLETYIRRTTH